MPYSENPVAPSVDNYMPAKLQQAQNAQMTTLLAQLAQAATMAKVNGESTAAQLQAELARNGTDQYRAETERTGQGLQADLQKLGIGSNYDLGMKQLANDQTLGQGSLDLQRQSLIDQRAAQDAGLKAVLARMGTMKDLYGMQTEAARREQAMQAFQDVLNRGGSVKEARAAMQLTLGGSGPTAGGQDPAALMEAGEKERKEKQINLSVPPLTNDLQTIFANNKGGKGVIQNSMERLAQVLSESTDPQKEMLRQMFNQEEVPENLLADPATYNKALDTLKQVVSGLNNEMGTFQNIIPNWMGGSQITNQQVSKLIPQMQQLLYTLQSKAKQGALKLF